MEFVEDLFHVEMNRLHDQSNCRASLDAGQPVFERHDIGRHILDRGQRAFQVAEGPDAVKTLLPLEPLLALVAKNGIVLD
jgi:hypothetical protein